MSLTGVQLKLNTVVLENTTISNPIVIKFKAPPTFCVTPDSVLLSAPINSEAIVTLPGATNEIQK